MTGTTNIILLLGSLEPDLALSVPDLAPSFYTKTGVDRWALAEIRYRRQLRIEII